MPSHDETPPPRAAAKAGPPSLVGAPRPAAPDNAGVRMLDAIGGSPRPAAAPAVPRRTLVWLGAGLLVAAVAGIAFSGRRAPAPVAAPPAPVAAAPVTPTAASPAVAQPASAPAAADTARIETPPEPPAAAAAPAAAVVAAAPSATASAPRAAARVAKATPPKPPASAARTRVAAAPQKTDPLGAPAARVTRDGSATRDADVDLIAALLARMGHAPAAGPAAASLDAPTIAQLVQRCDASPPEQARACRQRICEGYWGKAEACPVRLAPAKKG